MFIGAAGNSAEMPNPGVLTQFVGKSGSNTPAVSLYYDFEDDGIQSKNLEADQVRPAPGATINPDGNRLASYKNLNVDVGGPLWKDKVWGYFAYLNQRNSVAAPPSGVIQDGTPFNTKLFNYTGKGTYQMNQNNKFIGYLQHGTKQQPNRTDASNRLPGAVVHLTADSTVLQDSPSWVYKGEWNGTLTQNMFAEVRAGQFGYNFGLDSNTNGIRYEDLVTNEVSGGGRSWLNKRRRNQYTGAVSYFKDNFAGGSHNFKFGGEYLDESGNILWNQQYTDSVVHFLSNGVDHQRRRAPGHQRHQLAERAGADQLLRHRHLDDQPAHVERRRAVRPLSGVAAGAGDSGGALQPRRGADPRTERGRRVQQLRAALRRDLRPER